MPIERLDWRSRPPSLRVSGPEEMRWYCKVTDDVVLHRAEGGNMRCTACGRLVPGSEFVVLLATSEDYHKHHWLQVPDFLRPDYREPEEGQQ